MSRLLPSTILGGLPVMVSISGGKDADMPNGPGEYWNEVSAVFWQKKDGTAGKEIPAHILERANDYDWGLCTTIEQALENCMIEDEVANEPKPFTFKEPRS